MKQHEKPEDLTPRRQFLKIVGCGAAAALVGGSIVAGARRAFGGQTVWQIDPAKCTACGQCRSLCVKEISAVKATHHFPICGYCDLCMAYFPNGTQDRDTGAEKLQCPTGALVRRFVEEPFYEYTINRDLCNGCGKCVAGCVGFGNGSLFLQVHHDCCQNCNQCRIAANCPVDAFVRVPAEQAYRPNPRDWTVA
jgi:electron transport complex protein RnfB